jgi:hypothetical protein
MGDVMNQPWKVEFDEMGGYDCMSAAYEIITEDNQTVAVLDTEHYHTGESWDDSHQERSEARAAAEHIVRMHNMWLNFRKRWAEAAKTYGKTPQQIQEALGEKE